MANTLNKPQIKLSNAKRNELIIYNKEMYEKGLKDFPNSEYPITTAIGVVVYKGWLNDIKNN